VGRANGLDVKEDHGYGQPHLVMELAGSISHEYTCLVHEDLSMACSLQAMSRNSRWNLGEVTEFLIDGMHL
jgi:hypothetical protein